MTSSGIFRQYKYPYSLSHKLCRPLLGPKGDLQMAQVVLPPVQSLTPTMAHNKPKSYLHYPTIQFQMLISDTYFLCQIPK